MTKVDRLLPKRWNTSYSCTETKELYSGVTSLIGGKACAAHQVPKEQILMSESSDSDLNRRRPREDIGM